MQEPDKNQLNIITVQTRIEELPSPLASRHNPACYCGTDDAFLCQACDLSVHSANPLARCHNRVRLKTSSDDPAWHRGFTRKARTPGPNKKNISAKSQSGPASNPAHPSEDNDTEEEQPNPTHLCTLDQPVNDNGHLTCRAHGIT
ncbi:zinc finger B-box type family protein [Striga asiatica]|uniref:Zinc finger B-box type family protein n=1 Tax=Striga asiatica TaxID=4170 RepID=A0A5A7PTJ6_STRAF|nr:zinc finger B-box type family protein [Striga asiatica]